MHATSRREPGGRRHVPTRGPWQCRLRLLLLLCVRALAASTGMVLPDLSYVLEAQPSGLPPGHPECLVPDLPLSEIEQVLWAQLRTVTPRL